MIRRALALAVVLLFATATPASAGGPTSVVLSNPPHMVAFGYGDAVYEGLLELTQVRDPHPNDLKGTERHENGRRINAAWLNYGMSVWRIDYIYPDSPGGPWISTTETKDGGGRWSAPVWHRGTDPKALQRLLNSLELQGEQPVKVAQAAPVAELPPTPGTSVFTGWRWSILGLLMGFALAVGWLSWRSRESETP